MARTEELTRYVCLFDNAESAGLARRALETAGLGGVTMVGGAGSWTPSTGLQVLRDLHVPERQTEGLREDLRRGGVLLSVEAPASRRGEVEDVFERYTRRPDSAAAESAGVGLGVGAGAQEIELVETTEVPVVDKVARVVEEVRVRKVQTEHTAVVHDAVRHTEVEVERVNGEAAGGGVDRSRR